MEGAAEVLTQVALEGAIKKELGNLASGDAATQSRALAGLSVLVPQLPTAEPPAELVAALPQLHSLLREGPDGGEPDELVQANGCVLLATLLMMSEELWSAVVSAGFVETMVGLLRMAGRDSTLKLNAAAGLVEAMRGGDAAAKALVEAGGIALVVETCSAQLPARMQEVGADLMCCLATLPEWRGPLIQLGAVEALAGLLGTPDNDVRVRALIALGCLLPERPESQLALVQQEGVCAQLLGLMRQQDDLDIQEIAKNVFVGLAASQQCKPYIEAALRTGAAAAVAPPVAK